MNTIQQAAAQKFPIKENYDEWAMEGVDMSRNHYERTVTHYLEYLSQQGDDKIAELSLKSHNYGQHDLADDIFLEAFKQGLAIGRMQGDVVNPDTLPEDLVEQMTEYTSEAICEVVAKALAIGRQQGDGLTKACKDLLHLNTIDMEGMTRVSPNRWYEAFNKLSDIIYP
jgi:hypothetical protein